MSSQSLTFKFFFFTDWKAFLIYFGQNNIAPRPVISFNIYTFSLSLSRFLYRLVKTSRPTSQLKRYAYKNSSLRTLSCAMGGPLLDPLKAAFRASPMQIPFSAVVCKANASQSKRANEKKKKKIFN